MKLKKIISWVRNLITQGPAYAFYTSFWWIYTTRSLRNKAAMTPYSRIRRQLLVKSGIAIGPDTEIGFGTLILGIGQEPPAVTFGSRVAVGPYVIFVTSSYPDNSKLNSHPAVKKLVDKRGPIVVEDDVWIGANVTIFPKVRLGRGCIVAAGAVVRSDVPPMTIVAGVPARTVRVLDSQN